MRLFKSLADITPSAQGAVVAIGNFDGVHKGHKSVIGIARRIAASRDLPSGVLTFEPHPLRYFKPDVPPFRLTPTMAKARRIAALGIDNLYVAEFDKTFSEVSASDFVTKTLLGEIGAKHLVVGYDFVFGHKREGSLQTLREICAAHKVGVTVVEAVSGSGEGPAYSSTRVREALIDGRPDDAAAVLGEPWEIEGVVSKGDQRGRTIGFPTANVPVGDYLRPKAGVYAVRVGIAEPKTDEVASTSKGLPKQLDATHADKDVIRTGSADTVSASDTGDTADAADTSGTDVSGDAKPNGGWWRWEIGVANIGDRPTVDGTDFRLEAHLFDFDGDLYDQNVRVALVDFIRAEKKFDGLDALKKQIAKDCDSARAILAPGYSAVAARASKGRSEVGGKTGGKASTKP